MSETVHSTKLPIIPLAGLSSAWRLRVPSTWSSITCCLVLSCSRHGRMTMTLLKTERRVGLSHSTWRAEQKRIEEQGCWVQLQVAMLVAWLPACLIAGFPGPILASLDSGAGSSSVNAGRLRPRDGYIDLTENGCGGRRTGTAPVSCPSSPTITTDLHEAWSGLPCRVQCGNGSGRCSARSRGAANEPVLSLKPHRQQDIM